MENGKHMELLAKNGFYKSLVRRQLVGTQDYTKAN